MLASAAAVNGLDNYSRPLVTVDSSLFVTNLMATCAAGANPPRHSRAAARAGGESGTN